MHIHVFLTSLYMVTPRYSSIAVCLLHSDLWYLWGFSYILLAVHLGEHKPKRSLCKIQPSIVHMFIVNGGLNTSVWECFSCYVYMPYLCPASTCQLSLRFSRKNMILAALWFSEQKPTMSTYLGPLMEELNDLRINGIIHVYSMYMVPVKYHFPKTGLWSIRF